MGLQEIGQKMLYDVVPSALRRGDAAVADRLAAQQGATLADSLALGERSAPEMLSRFNAKVLAESPQRLKLKYQNMAISPARFLTGQPELYAYDMRGLLAQGRPLVPLQGDMHMNNFGAVELASGKVKVRMNDFDEAYPGPVFYDLNRMATDITLLAQERGLSDAQAKSLVKNFAGSYHDTMGALAKGAEPPKIKAPGVLKSMLKQARGQDVQKWLDKRVPLKGGKRAFPRDASSTSVSPQTFSDLQRGLDAYRAGLPKAEAQALAPYHVSDAVDVLGGTGSLGAQRYHLLLEAPKRKPILLQFKEQGPAAPEQFGPKVAHYPSEGERNVTLANMLDGGADPFRGAATLPARDDIASRSFVVERQRPVDGAVSITQVKHTHDFAQLARYYGAQGAKAHARGAAGGFASAQTILAELGNKGDFTDRLTRFGSQYAARVNRDFAAFKQALKSDPLLKHQG